MNNITSIVFTETKDKKLMIHKSIHVLEFLIPNSYFDAGIAKFYSDQIETIGIIPIRYKLIENSPFKYMQLSLPIAIKINVYEELYTKSFSLSSGDEPEQYTIITIPKNSVAIDSTMHIQSLFNVIDFLELFNSGKISNTIKYSDIVNLYKDAFIKNGLSTGVPSTIIEAMIAEMCRDENDNNKLFKFTAGKTGKQFGYEFVSLKSVAETSSTLAALAFENINKAIRTSISQKRNNLEQRISPMETLLKY